jgi:hypothetical protein
MMRMADHTDPKMEREKESQAQRDVPPPEHMEGNVREVPAGSDVDFPA